MCVNMDWGKIATSAAQTAISLSPLLIQPPETPKLENPDYSGLDLSQTTILTQNEESEDKRRRARRSILDTIKTSPQGTSLPKLKQPSLLNSFTSGKSQLGV